MSLTASVNLDRAFINLATFPLNHISFGTAGSIGGGGQRSDQIQQEGSFRYYANGVTRLIRGTTQIRGASFVARALTPSDLEQLISWVGQTVLFRDTYGRRFWGSYLVTSVTDIPLSRQPGASHLSDVALTIQTLTWDESV